ncbi:MAG: hypothetical protein ACJ8EW_12810 [Rhizobium sp.]|uniref:hypothetical protein n=1 Tax=Rhizobium TaxID=379 RepID=UPI001C97566D|nr:hypothetical protein [Rhizobium leguminosarum]
MRSPKSENPSIFCPNAAGERRSPLADVDLALLAQQNAEILEELRALRREVAELKEQSGRTLDFERRNDPRRPNSLTQR